MLLYQPFRNCNLSDIRSMKTCSKCQQEKSYSEFHKAKNIRDGYRPDCKECRGKAAENGILKQQGLKRCHGCKEVRSLDWFGLKRTTLLRNIYTEPKCRLCRSIEVSMRNISGLTIERYWAIHRSQNGLCAICGQPESKKVRRDGSVIRRLSVDHCHETGVVRGLLCGKCNAGIALLRHDTRLLDAAKTYLSRS